MTYTKLYEDIGRSSVTGVDYGSELICANGVNHQVLQGISLKLRDDFVIIRLLLLKTWLVARYSVLLDL